MASEPKSLARSLRTLSLDLYARSYFSGIRFSRRFTLWGRVMLTLAGASFIMSADSARESSRYLFAFLVGSFVLGFILARIGRPKISFERLLPPRVQAGERFVYKIRAVNLGSRSSPPLECRDVSRIRFPDLSLWLRSSAPFEAALGAFDRWAGYPKWLWLANLGCDILGSDFVVPSLAPGASVEIELSAVCPSRGERKFFGVHCSLRDPFGLVRGLWFLPVRASLLSLPKLLPAPVDLPAGSRSDRPGEAPDPLKTGESEEFRCLRDWRPGDPLKRIDWRATARRGSPVAREFAPEFFRRTIVAVDSYLPDESRSPDFETAVSMAAGMIGGADRKDMKVDLLIASGIQDPIPLGHGPEGTLRAFELLASLEPDSFDRISEMAASIVSQSNNFSGAVLFTTRWCPSIQAAAASMASAGLAFQVVCVAPPPQNRPDPRVHFVGAAQ